MINNLLFSNVDIFAMECGANITMNIKDNFVPVNDF